MINNNAFLVLILYLARNEIAQNRYFFQSDFRRDKNQIALILEVQKTK